MLQHLYETASNICRKSNHIHAVIETPKGCAAKYNFDSGSGLFKLKKILPAGMVFPFHFGFIPFTLAEDSDPLDVFVLMDEPSWPGCFVECKVLGVIEAEQKEEEETERNDRIISAAIESNRYKEIKTLFAPDAYLLDEIINFLITYTSFEKKVFRIIGKRGPATAVRIIKNQMLK